MLIGDLSRILLTGDKARDRVHRTRPVQGNDCRNILDALGFQADAHPGHARRLHLEHAGSLSLGEHLIGLRIVLRDIAQAEIRLRLLDHFQRVV